MWIRLSVMQVFVCFKWSPGALQVFRPLGDRCQEACWTDCLAPKGPGTTDTAGTQTHKHTLSLSNSATYTHTHYNFKALYSKTTFCSNIIATESLNDAVLSLVLRAEGLKTQCSAGFDPNRRLLSRSSFD